jgi:hypothetical protein
MEGVLMLFTVRRAIFFISVPSAGTAGLAAC